MADSGFDLGGGRGLGQRWAGVPCLCEKLGIKAREENFRKLNVLGIKNIIGVRPLGWGRAGCAPHPDPLVFIKNIARVAGCKVLISYKQAASIYSITNSVIFHSTCTKTFLYN